MPAALLIPAAAIVFSLSSCGGDDNNNTTADSVSQDTVQTQPVSMEFARVPSPAEMFIFMKGLGTANVGADLLNSVDNEKGYESKKSQALNLGVYSADLLYCSTFDLSNKVVGYFGVCMRMGDKLQVATSISEKDKDRINKNTGNSDSLIAISNDLYLSSFQNLETNDRGADLSLMLAGGWVESLYLMSSMVKDFEKDKQAAVKVAEQGSALDNLIEYMTQHESNADVASVLQQLKELRASFEGIKTTQGGGMTNKNGKKVLGGGSKTEVTKEQFEAIQKKTAEVRKSIVDSH
ncbi:MAG: hypothetical protein Fur0041_17290 [Bacteroidia bacterium]